MVILFRGKRIDGKGWVEGVPYFIESENLAFIINNCQTLVFSKQDTSFSGLQVIPESVGQYIGIKGYVGDYKTRHKNEVKLFTGDLVEAYSQGAKAIFEIRYRREGSPSFILYPAFQSKLFWKIHGSDLGRKYGDFYDDLRIVGNVFDNPYLIDKITKELRIL